MSSPVTVDVAIVDLDLFAQAARAEGYDMKEVMNGDVITGLEYGSGYGKVTVNYDHEKKNFKLKADDGHITAFRNKVIPHYNALQLRQKLEETGRYTFADNWMTRTSTSTVEVNAMFREN